MKERQHILFMLPDVILVYFERYYQGVKPKKNHEGTLSKDTSAIVKSFPDKNEFTYRIIPDTIIQYEL
jgi:hypothetical protein